ncbi:MAG: hypothetical protein ACO3QP_02905, partial [Burkholderiaceae bacterium]
QALLCGHLHRMLMTRWHGAALVVAPSTAFQARLRFGAGRFEPDLREAEFSSLDTATGLVWRAIVMWFFMVLLFHLGRWFA